MTALALWIKVCAYLTLGTIFLCIMISAIPIFWAPTLGEIHWYNFVEAFAQFMLGMFALVALIMYGTREPK